MRPEGTGPVFCLLLGVSSDYAQTITGQFTEVTCPVIGRAQSDLTPSKTQKTGPDLYRINSSPPGQNDRHFTDDMFKSIFVNKKLCILIKILMKFVPKGPVDNNTTFG